MATFTDQLALAELMGQSFAPIRRLGQAEVALAQQDLARARALEDRAIEREAQEAFAVRQDQRYAKREEASQKRQQQAEIEKEKRAYAAEQQAIRDALIAEAQAYGIQLTPDMPAADIRFKIQEQDAKLMGQSAQKLRDLGTQLNALTSVPEAERNQYFTNLVMEDMAVQSVLQKYPDIATRLASGQITAGKALEELKTTRDAAEASRAFSLAIPRASSAVTSYIVARESESRNYPRVKSIAQEIESETRLYEHRAKRVHNPDLVERYQPKNRALTTRESGQPSATGLPMPPNTRPAPTSQAEQPRPRFESSLPNELNPRPIVVDPSWRIDTPVPMEFYSPMNIPGNFRGSMALPEGSNMLRAPAVVPPTVLFSAPSQSAFPLLQSEIDSAIRGRQQPLFVPLNIP